MYKATFLPTWAGKIGYCQCVTFVYEKDSADIWRMLLVIAYCHSMRLEGSVSLASDCYSHDKKGLPSLLINLLGNRMSHWHFKLSCCFVHRIILSLNSLRLWLSYLDELQPKSHSLTCTQDQILLFIKMINSFVLGVTHTWARLPLAPFLTGSPWANDVFSLGLSFLIWTKRNNNLLDFSYQDQVNNTQKALKTRQRKYNL